MKITIAAATLFIILIFNDFSIEKTFFQTPSIIIVLMVALELLHLVNKRKFVRKYYTALIVFSILFIVLYFITSFSIFLIVGVAIFLSTIINMPIKLH